MYGSAGACDQLLLLLLLQLLSLRLSAHDHRIGLRFVQCLTPANGGEQVVRRPMHGQKNSLPQLSVSP